MHLCVPVRWTGCSKKLVLMAKNKSLKKTSRKPAKKAGGVTGRGGNGVVANKGNDEARLTHERLRKLAKKHRPPDDYFVGEMEKPW